MLSPKYLDGIADEITEIYSQLETDILQRLAKRLKKMGKPTEASEWQAKILAESGGIKGDVSKILKGYSRDIQKTVTSLVTDALAKSNETDNRIFEKMIGRKVSLPAEQTMLSIIQRTYSDLSRITQTTAYHTEQEFVKQANRAYMNVQSGAFSYDEAMRMACDELAGKGISQVYYSNGRPVTKSIETAARMNIITAVNHTVANISLNNCEELDCDLVEVSAHAGARPDHAEWQGRIFSRSGTSRKYADFAICHLGEIDGLCGINCRHSFYPYFEGMEKHFDREELAEMKDPERYEEEQKQRHMERQIRYYKRRAVVEEAGGVDNTRSRVKLGEWQARAKEHAEKFNINRDYRRERIGTKDGKQVRGIQNVKADRLIPKNELKAAAESVRLFPKENFIEESKNVFIAESRKPINKQETIKLEKEKAQAEILARNGHTVYLVSEKNDLGTGVKKYDAIVDGYSMDFKHVSGGIQKVADNFSKGIEQAQNVFLEIEKDFSCTEIRNCLIGKINNLKIHNALGTKHTDGYIYFTIGKSETLHKWNVKKLIDEVK